MASAQPRRPEEEEKLMSMELKEVEEAILVEEGEEAGLGLGCQPSCLTDPQVTDQLTSWLSN